MRIKELVLKKVACFDELRIAFLEGSDPNKADIHLLVGANGTGKSTILMALAQFFAYQLTGLSSRFTGLDSMAAIKTYDGQHHVLQSIQPQVGSVVFDEHYLSRVDHIGGQLAHVYSDQKLKKYRDDITRHRPQNNNLEVVKQTFAAFGYSGFRSTEKTALHAIQEQADNPLLRALMFDNPDASKELIQWIANTKAKEAFARNRGDNEKADERKEAVLRIERIISEIIEQPFSFILNEDPIGVLIDVDGTALEIDLLPDGLKSILSWVADLLMRLDRTPWENDIPVLERPFLLFLDEIEVHLHPAWQRKILPAIQGLFPNAQVFVSTHSPFVIASADDAWIYPLVRKGSYTTVKKTIPSMKGNSYATILREPLGINAEFSEEVETLFDAFYQARDNALQGVDGALTEMRRLRDELAAFGQEVTAVVVPELRQTERRLELTPEDSDK